MSELAAPATSKASDNAETEEFDMFESEVAFYRMRH
jgi:hypothetical protein